MELHEEGEFEAESIMVGRTDLKPGFQDVIAVSTTIQVWYPRQVLNSIAAWCLHLYVGVNNRTVSQGL